MGLGRHIRPGPQPARDRLSDPLDPTAGQHAARGVRSSQLESPISATWSWYDDSERSFSNSSAYARASSGSPAKMR